MSYVSNLLITSFLRQTSWSEHCAHFLLQIELGMMYRFLFLGDGVSIVVFIAVLQSGRR